MAAPPGPKPYETRLRALRELEKYLADLDVPSYFVYDFPQQASSWTNDPWQPVLLVGDIGATTDIKYLHSPKGWYFAVDGWMNNRGDDANQVAGELALWWAEVRAPEAH